MVGCHVGWHCLGTTGDYEEGTAMQYRVLGRTGQRVSEVGMGTWNLAGDWGPPDDAEALRALREAFDCGITFFDSALGYGDGHSEELIGRALRDVRERVVIATNGDGQLVAALRDFRRLFPNSDDFVRMGFLRQQESLLGLRVLGIRPDMVSFLSYPDAGLSALWQNHWLASAPYYSPYSHSDSSPYPLTYNPTAVYAGTDLLDDLCTILEDQRPGLIVFPHPSDQHADHRSLSVFTRLAVAMLQHEDPSYQPEMLT